MNRYVIQRVWPDAEASIQREVVDFWLREAAMPEGRALERASQLVVIGRTKDAQEVAGVTTVLRCFQDQLGFECYFFRAFVGKAHRARGLRSTQLIQRLIRETYDVLNERYQSGCDPEVPGLYFEIENSNVVRNRTELVWRDCDANVVYIGTSPSNRQRRIWYFQNAVLPN